MLYTFKQYYKSTVSQKAEEKNKKQEAGISLIVQQRHLVG